MGLQGYSAEGLEKALGTLWELVESRLTEEDYKALGVDRDSEKSIQGIFQELHAFGKGGPVGLGLGKCGGHAVG